MSDTIMWSLALPQEGEKKDDVLSVLVGWVGDLRPTEHPEDERNSARPAVRCGNGTQLL